MTDLSSSPDSWHQTPDSSVCISTTSELLHAADEEMMISRSEGKARLTLDWMTLDAKRFSWPRNFAQIGRVSFQ